MRQRSNTWLAGWLLLAGALLQPVAAWCAPATEGPVAPPFPPVLGREYLASWTTGEAQADRAEDPLVLVCLGDSNTELTTYVGGLRDILQGCYGDRGIGYHTFGNRAPMPEAPKLERSGNWELLDTSPTPPPPPWFGVDGLWAATEDPQAALSVTFDQRAWGEAPDPLGRIYDGQHRVRVHYQTGPGLGSFGVFSGEFQLFRVNCQAEKPAYGLTQPFLTTGFRVAGAQGKVVLLGYDGERQNYLHGQPTLAGGALVHALGNGWGQAREAAAIEPEAYNAFLAAVKPDLITIAFGTNDMHNDGVVLNYVTHLTTLVRKLQVAAPGVGILIISCPEASQTAAGLAATYRDAARQVAADEHCAFWSLTDLIGPRSEQWTRQGFFADGLHYSRLGGSLWARLLLQALGFDAADPRHYPALAPAAPAQPPPALTIRRLPPIAGLDQVGEALRQEPACTIWRQDAKAADLRLAVAGKSLAVEARVYAGQCVGAPATWGPSGFDLYLANPQVLSDNRFAPGPVVKQIIFGGAPPAQGPQVTVHQYETPEVPADFPWQVTPLQPSGYEVRALVPLSLVNLDADGKEFLLEASALTAPGPGAPAVFSRLFGSRPDRGAFRDADQSARVTVR